MAPNTEDQLANLSDLQRAEIETLRKDAIEKDREIGDLSARLNKAWQQIDHYKADLLSDWDTCGVKSLDPDEHHDGCAYRDEIERIQNTEPLDVMR